MSVIVLLTLCVAGLIWSLVPFGGNTLPHRVEHLLDLSFNGAALVVSFLIGMLGVGALGVATLFQAFEIHTDDE